MIPTEVVIGIIVGLAALRLIYPVVLVGYFLYECWRHASEIVDGE
jgi:hypothetical protein